jgi:predicted O-methyltransferase YrrM
MIKQTLLDAYQHGLRFGLRRTFRFWERLGFHITPNNFYEPVPDTRRLSESLWAKPSDLVGINLPAAPQLELLASFAARFRDEYELFPSAPTAWPSEYYVRNRLFESVDGEILYCMIRHLRPSRIVEIGSGFSTYLAAQAIGRNLRDDGSYKCELVAIEPHPNATLRAGFSGLSRLIAKPVQEIPLTEFANLKENDILFIDSSHVLQIGSDVQYEYLEILPRLAKGVVVHVHDIFLPSEYPRRLALGDRRFYNEQYLLQAFLTFNTAFEVLWAGSFMHLRHSDALAAAFPSYDPATVWPGSFWIRRLA